MEQVRKVEARWTPKLAASFCPVSSFFLQNYHRLRPHPGARGLTSTEVLTIIHIVDHKWDERAPFPAVTTLAKRMGITPRAVRAALQSLEQSGYIKRVPIAAGGRNRYELDGLFRALERLMDDDEEKAA